MTRALELAIEEHAKPDTIVCDNGPEFTYLHFLQWAARQRIDVQHIEPGKPCLSTQWFERLRHARSVISDWQAHYNEHRPHSALGYRAPNSFAVTYRVAA